MIAPRTIVTTLRTAVYGGLGGWLAISSAEAKGLLDAVIVGAVFADYLTWGLRSLALLPTYVWHRCWEGCVNVAFGYALYRYGGFELDTDLQYVAVAFLVFLFVAGLKVSYYAVMYITEGVDDA